MSFKTIDTWEDESVLTDPISFRGIGLHTGKNTAISIQDNPEKNGIYFIRNEFSTHIQPDRLNTSSRTTSLVNDSGETVATTIEHLLSAFYALKVKNVIVEIQQGNEIPILNGSSDLFIEGIQSVTQQVRKKCQIISVDTPITITDDTSKDRFISLKPISDNALVIKSGVSYTNSPVGEENFTFIYENLDNYLKEISQARTSYPFYISEDGDFDCLKARLKGMHTSGSLKNVNLWDPKYFTGVNFQNEISRHKILDFLGDLYINVIRFASGIEITLQKSGHSLNNKLAAIISSKCLKT